MGCFKEDFENKADVAKAFRVELKELGNIIYAAYHSDGYDGNAFVLFEKDGTLYEVNGGHCSCFGLEDQWDPEETTLADLAYRIEMGRLGRYASLVEVLTEYERGNR